MKLPVAFRAGITASILVFSTGFAAREIPQNPGPPLRTPTRVAPAPKPRTTQRMYAPLPTVSASWVDANVVLNNNSPQAMDVTPTVYSNGVGVAGAPVTVASGEARWVTLSQLAETTGQRLHALDGLELSYIGHSMELGAQILLVRPGHGSVDVPFSMAMEYQSWRQEAVWAFPAGARSIVSLGNASDTTVSVTLQRPGAGSEELELLPHVSRTIVRESSLSASSSGVDWMVLEVRGPRGSLRATGFVERGGRFAGGIRFYDPDAARQADVFATNLRVGTARPVLALKNTSDVAITATPRFLPFDAAASAVELTPVSIEPHAATLVDLRPLIAAAASRQDLEHVSVHVSNTGLPGSLIGSLSATALDGRRAYDVPLRDSGPVPHATGSYPWRIEGDASTVVSITNVSARDAKYHARIVYPGGIYWLRAAEVPVGGTAVFDLRELRDNAVPDMWGNTLPKAVTAGQFRWSTIHGNGETQLTGRAEIVSDTDDRSSSYSCFICCGDSVDYGLLYPDRFGVPLTGTNDTGVYEHWYDCHAIRTQGLHVSGVPQRRADSPIVWRDVPFADAVSQDGVRAGPNVGSLHGRGGVQHVWFAAHPGCRHGRREHGPARVLVPQMAPAPAAQAGSLRASC